MRLSKNELRICLLPIKPQKHELRISTSYNLLNVRTKEIQLCIRGKGWRFKHLHHLQMGPMTRKRMLLFKFKIDESSQPWALNCNLLNEMQEFTLWWGITPPFTDYKEMLIIAFDQHTIDNVNDLIQATTLINKVVIPFHANIAKIIIARTMNSFTIGNDFD